MAVPQPDTDRETPAQIRRIFVILSFAASVLLIIPFQWVSSLMMLAVTIGLGIWNARKTQSEEPATFVQGSGEPTEGTTEEATRDRDDA